MPDAAGGADIPGMEMTMRVVHVIAALVALAPSACNGISSPPGKGAGANSAAPSRSEADTVTYYICEDGSTIAARYPTPDTARILHEERSIDLNLARSASGARYVGEGWQWWTKGMIEGTLTSLAANEEVASASGLACAARQEGQDP